MTATPTLRSPPLPTLGARLWRSVRETAQNLARSAVHLAALVLPLPGTSVAAQVPEPPAPPLLPRLAAFGVPLLSITLGWLAGVQGWFGLSIEELSDRDNGGVLIQPTNGAFSIWGPIYAGLLGLAASQAFRPGADPLGEGYVRARLPLVVNMLLNFVWFVVTQREQQGLSLLVLVGQFLTALWLYFSLRVHVPGLRGRGIQRLIRGSASLYAGWLTVATVISVAGLLNSAGFRVLGLSDEAWTVVMLIVSAGIGFLGRFAWRDRVYGAVFVWAFGGIAVKAGQPDGVVVTAWVLAATMLASLAFGERDGENRTA